MLGKAGIKVSTVWMCRHVPPLVLSCIRSGRSEYGNSGGGHRGQVELWVQMGGHIENA